MAQYQDDGYVRLKDVAQRENLSEKYLESIAAALRRDRKIVSSRGHEGGYRLAKSAGEYSVGEIIKCLEGELLPVSCSGANATCENRNECLCVPLWDKLHKAMNEVLENTSLQDLIDSNVN